MEARGLPACSVGLACSVEDDARIPCCDPRNKTNHPSFIIFLLSTMYQIFSLSLTDVRLDQAPPARVAVLNEAQSPLRLAGEPCVGLLPLPTSKAQPPSRTRRRITTLSLAFSLYLSSFIGAIFPHLNLNFLVHVYIIFPSSRRVWFTTAAAALWFSSLYIPFPTCMPFFLVGLIHPRKFARPYAQPRTNCLSSRQ